RMHAQLLGDCVGAVERLDVPAQSQHVAPMAVRMEKRPSRAVIAAVDRKLELRQPVLRCDRNIVGFVEHWRFPSPAGFAALVPVKAYTVRHRPESGLFEKREHVALLWGNATGQGIEIDPLHGGGSAAFSDGQPALQIRRQTGPGLREPRLDTTRSPLF